MGTCLILFDQAMSHVQAWARDSGPLAAIVIAFVVWLFFDLLIAGISSIRGVDKK